MGLRPTKGDESRGPGMPGPYRRRYRVYAIGSGAPCRGHACVARGSARRRVTFNGAVLAVKVLVAGHGRRGSDRLAAREPGLGAFDQ